MATIYDQESIDRSIALSIAKAKTNDLEKITKYLKEKFVIAKADTNYVNALINRLVSSGVLLKTKSGYELTEKSKKIIKEQEKLRKRGVLF